MISGFQTITAGVLWSGICSWDKLLEFSLTGWQWDGVLETKELGESDSQSIYKWLAIK